MIFAFALLDQGVYWINKRRQHIYIRDMDADYRTNTVGFLMRHAPSIALEARPVIAVEPGVVAQPLDALLPLIRSDAVDEWEQREELRQTDPPTWVQQSELVKALSKTADPF